MIVEMESDVCACEEESMYLQERMYWRERKKKERKKDVEACIYLQAKQS